MLDDEEEDVVVVDFAVARAVELMMMMVMMNLNDDLLTARPNRFDQVDGKKLTLVVELMMTMTSATQK